MTTATLPRLLSVEEVASIIGTSEDRVRKLIINGELEVITVSARVRRVEEGALCAYLDSRRSGGTKGQPSAA